MKVAIPATGKAGGAKLELPEYRQITQDSDLAAVKFGKINTLFIHSRAAGRHGSQPQALLLSDDKTCYGLDLTNLSADKVADTVGEVLENPKVGKIGYDIKADIKLLKNLDIGLQSVAHDDLVAAFLINPLLRAQSLTDLAIANLRYEGVQFEDLPTEDFLDRGAELMALIAKLHHVQQHELNEVPKIDKLAKEIEWPLTPVLADMEYTGIKLDVKYLRKFADQLEDSISDLEQTIYGHADHEFNISSPSQLADVLFVKLNLPTQFVKKGKTGYSTAAIELDKLRGLHPIIDLITQYREATKLKNTYVDTLPKMVDENSRVHTTFNLTIAPTGRLSSADPNLQNIPVRTELGRNIRTAFVAEKGKVLVSADYSQFELRIAAALSGDEGMINAFNKDADIHVQTAAEIYGIKASDVTKAQRSSVKEVNFGIMYGLGPHALSQSTGMSFTEAKDFIARYFEIRPKLKDLIEKLRNDAQVQGYVETLLGRRRPTPDVKSSNFAVREAAYRAAVNMPLQGTAADLMKMAMVKIQKELDARFGETSKQKLGTSPITNSQLLIPSAKPVMLLQIHDSILVETPESLAKQAGDLLKDTMENIYKLPVKLKVDITTGKNWGEL